MDESVILIKPILPKDKTESGIILPPKPKFYQEGVVAKTGKLKQKITVGDKLMYANRIQTEVDYDGENCHLIHEEYALAII